MEFINKVNQAIFFPIYQGFENETWNNDEQRYFGYEYGRLPGAVKENLILEQQSLCCYCMMTLTNDRSTTLEHIFPQKPKAVDLLRNYNVSCVDGRQFNYSSRNVPCNTLMNLPHDVSYYNLIASCDSKISCNNGRGNELIRSFFFDPQVKAKFHYDINGEIFSEEYEAEVTILGLSNLDLVKYRKLWKYLKGKNINPPSLTAEQLKNEVMTAALELGIKDNDSFFTLFIEPNETKLNKAMRYGYFYI